MGPFSTSWVPVLLTISDTWETSHWPVLIKTIFPWIYLNGKLTIFFRVERKDEYIDNIQHRLELGPYHLRFLYESAHCVQTPEIIINHLSGSKNVLNFWLSLQERRRRKGGPPYFCFQLINFLFCIYVYYIRNSLRAFNFIFVPYSSVSAGMPSRIYMFMFHPCKCLWRDV